MTGASGGHSWRLRPEVVAGIAAAAVAAVAVNTCKVRDPAMTKVGSLCSVRGEQSKLLFSCGVWTLVLVVHIVEVQGT